MNRLPSIRRWGVAALTGVTLFGGLSIVGAGAASAATSPTVTAAVTSTATTVLGTGTAQAGASLSLSVSGTPAPAGGDQLTLTLACPTTGTASIHSVTLTAGSGFTAGAPVAENVGTGACSYVTFTAGANAPANPVLAISAITYDTSGVGSQALTLTGTYETLGLAATSFTVPTDANVLWFGATSNAPAVTIAATGTTPISSITIQDPANIGSAQVSGAPATAVTNVTHTGTSTDTITVANPIADPQLYVADSTANAFVLTASAAVSAVVATGVPNGMSLNIPSQTLAVNGTETLTLTGTPTSTQSSTDLVITVTDANGTTVATTPLVIVAVAPIVLTLPAGIFWSGTPTVSSVGFTVTAPGAQPGNSNVLTLPVTAEQALSGQSLTISGLSVVTSSQAPGSVDATVTYNGGVVMFSQLAVGAILGKVTTIYGADGTADGTVAAEFENAYPAATGGNANVVLATDTPHTNGSDALAASYLEGTLHTGLLITPATTLGADARLAMQLEGVTTVYVVGGPLAISPAVIAQLKATPAYAAGGLTLTGNNINVVGPIYGADGTAEGTAAAIATQFGIAYGSGSFAGAYSATGGLYNDTTGAATATGPASPVPTAIVVASSDWQDAMSIAPEAFNMRFPVILAGPSSSTTLGADAQSALTSLGVKQVIVIGGQLALQNSVEAQIAALNGGISVLRIAGIDATDTAAQIANFALAASGSGLGWVPGTAKAVLASHADYWTDALGAAALGGGANANFGTEPLVLVENPTTVGQYTTAEMSKLGAAGIANLTVLGGPLAMPASTVQSLLMGL